MKDERKEEKNERRKKTMKRRRIKENSGKNENKKKKRKKIDNDKIWKKIGKLERELKTTKDKWKIKMNYGNENENERKLETGQFKGWKFDLISLYGISTIVGYLMSNPVFTYIKYRICKYIL